MHQDGIIEKWELVDYSFFPGSEDQYEKLNFEFCMSFKQKVCFKYF